MKKELLTLFFIAFSYASQAQSWSVINATDKFNYRLDNDNVVSATIWSDSLRVNGTDTIFFLNRILCDSCATVIGGPAQCDTCYGLKNQPQFLQRKCMVAANAIQFFDTGNVVLHPFAILNDSWIFDSAQSITATVISENIDSVFGSADSIKMILLTTGDTIVLSQNFGLLQYPNGYGHNSYYRLTGIEGRNLGEKIPKYADFFNFDVGDMFEYHGRYSYLGGSFCYPDAACDYIRKITIISRSQSGDTLNYGFTGLYRESCIDPTSPFSTVCITHSALSGVDQYIDSSGNWLNRSYPNQAIKLENLFDYPDLPCLDNDSAYDFVKMRKDTNLRVSKYIGMDNTECLPNFFNCHYQYESEIYRHSDTLFFNNAPWEYAQAAATGLGITNYVWGRCFEGGVEEFLVAYRKGNDTVGVFTLDSLLVLGVEERDFSKNIIVYPNPVNTTVNVHLTIYMKGEILITDIRGKTLIEQNLNGNKATIDTGHLSNGLYFLIIKYQDGIFSKKVVIMH
jgi:hypothetical protein